MDLLKRMDAYKREASWAVWDVDASGKVADPTFPLSQARSAIHGRAMLISLNPASIRAPLATLTTEPWANFHSVDKRHNDAFLADALVGTDLWGCYMTDLHPNISESDSRLVRARAEDLRLAVESLIEQAELLDAVRLIVCVGRQSYKSVKRFRDALEDRIGLPQESLVSIPHYSRANGGVHKHSIQRYRELIAAALRQADGTN